MGDLRKRPRPARERIAAALRTMRAPRHHLRASFVQQAILLTFAAALLVTSIGNLLAGTTNVVGGRLVLWP